MKIVFDMTPVYDHLTGIERYNVNIAKEMIKGHPENSYVLLFKNEVHESFKDIVKKRNVKYALIPECNKFLFIQWRLFRALNNIKADYYIFLSFTSPILFRNRRIVNAIHDLTCWDCPDTIPAKMKLYYRYTYKVAAKHSWKIVTVSKFSQKRICKKYKLEKRKVPVIYDGLTDIFMEKPRINPLLRSKYNLPDRYILSLSTLEPRKNLQLLILAYKEMVELNKDLPDLVLAGREGWKLEDVIGTVDEIVKKRIHFTGFINDDDLAQIYREAEVFVFPSRYEGFGLPVIEAMSQGTIVVCSDAASLPEVAGDAGLLFKSDDKKMLIQTLDEALSLDENEKRHRVDRGKIISNSFSWENEAEKLYRILNKNNG